MERGHGSWPAEGHDAKRTALNRETERSDKAASAARPKAAPPDRGCRRFRQGDRKYTAADGTERIAYDIVANKVEVLDG